MIILCDSQWCDPDLDSSNGIQMGLRDMLRIDSMLMMVQLNIRVLLEVCLNLLLYILVQCQFAIGRRGGGGDLLCQVYASNRCIAKLLIHDHDGE